MTETKILFNSIRMITYSVGDFSASVEAMQTCLNYQLREQGEVSAEVAGLWGAPDVEGNRFALLAPQSGDDFSIRFIETERLEEYQPLKTYGWNAAEFLVKDVYALAENLQDSAYTIIGGPRDLLEDGTAIALQVRGPSDEIFYLTELHGEQFHQVYGTAQCPVDRAFIAVLGAKDHSASTEYYASKGCEISPSQSLTIRVLANAHAMDPLTSEFKIASAQLAAQYRLEIDAYPSSATERSWPLGSLPPGLSMVSLTTENLDDFDLVHNEIFELPDSLPYFNCRAAMQRGASGEWLEVLESA